MHPDPLHPRALLDISGANRRALTNAGLSRIVSGDGSRLERTVRGRPVVDLVDVYWYPAGVT